MIPGVVLQELLSGARTDEQMDRLGAAVAGFRILLATREHHLEAARLANACRHVGVTAATVDCLIAAQTIAAGAELLTTDNDFTPMAGCCPLRLVPLA